MVAYDRAVTRVDEAAVAVPQAQADARGLAEDGLLLLREDAALAGVDHGLFRGGHGGAVHVALEGEGVRQRGVGSGDLAVQRWLRRGQEDGGVRCESGH